MLRLAILLFLVIIGLLFGLSFLPDSQRAVPDATIKLSDATITLFPQEDPEAIWYFSSPNVNYDPDLRETTLFNVHDGKRTLVGKTDFTLESDEVTISGDDNLYGNKIVVSLIEEATTLDMQAKEGRQVLINQSQGQFEIPRVELSGDMRGIKENMYISFDLRKFSAGGPGTVGITEFDIGKSDGH